MFNKSTAVIALTAPVLLVTSCITNTPDYTALQPQIVADEIVILSAGDGREIPVRVLTPEGCTACPLIIFSHGANAAFDRYDKLTLPLAKAGYRLAIPNHTDSEDHPNRAAYTAPDWLPTRIEDYEVIAAHYETDYRIAAGHSFGALIAQIAGGAEISRGANIEAAVDPAFRPAAVLAYSPPGLIPNYIEAEGWSKLQVPSLVTTGTTDIVPMMAEQWELHLASFEAAPPGTAYALIYEGMDHYMDGAYGRETDAPSTARDQAMAHMAEASLYFLSMQKSPGGLSSAQWDTQNTNFVEARTRK